MKLQQIRCLLAVVDNHFNVTQAAESLFTSQPGVSKQIRLLEGQLGVPLFIRHGKRLRGLTGAGKRFLPHARVIAQEVKQMRALASDLREDYRRASSGDNSPGTLA